MWRNYSVSPSAVLDDADVRRQLFLRAAMENAKYVDMHMTSYALSAVAKEVCVI